MCSSCLLLLILIQSIHLFAQSILLLLLSLILSLLCFISTFSFVFSFTLDDKVRWIGVGCCCTLKFASDVSSSSSYALFQSMYHLLVRCKRLCSDFIFNQYAISWCLYTISWYILIVPCFSWACGANRLKHHSTVRFP
eukprot:475729_1